MRTSDAARDPKQRLCFYGLAFLAFFLPFYNSLASFGIGLMLLGVIATVFSRKRGQLLDRDFGPVALFFGACLLSLLVNPAAFPMSLVGLRKGLLYLAIVLGCPLALRNTDQNIKLIALLTGAALVTAGDGIYQLLAGYDFFSSRPLMTYPQGMVIRVTGPFKQAAACAIYLECVLAALIVTVIGRARRDRLKETIACALLLGTLLLTLTPATPLVLGTVFLITTLIFRKPRLNLIFLAVPAALWAFPADTRSHLLRLLAENTAARLRMFEIGCRIFFERPLFGHGLNTFSHNYSAAAQAGDPFFGMGAPYAHNMYIQLGCETGLFGLAAFGYLIIWTLRRLLREGGRGLMLRRALAMSLIAYLIHGIFESSLQTSHGALIFWILIGLCLASLRIKKP